jgi:hypothetical protein
VAGIQAVGFIERDKRGRPKPTGRGGVQGFIEWLALHEPKTAAALFALAVIQPDLDCRPFGLVIRV